MHRFGSVMLAALAFLVSGCGSAEPASEDPPAPADLVADAFAALAEAGSAHYVVDLRVGLDDADPTAPIVLHAEGGASTTAFTAAGNLDFGFGPMEGKLLVGPRDFFLNFDGEWYGKSGAGLATALAALARQEEVSADLGSPDGIRSGFDRFFAGHVGPGPQIDGVETWQFEGRVNPKGLADLADGNLSDADRRRLDRLAAATHLLLVVGREDQLPRRVELTFRLSEEDQAEFGDGFDSGDFQSWSRSTVDAKLVLSRFGEPVSYDLPEDFGSLDAFLDDFFSFE